MLIPSARGRITTEGSHYNFSRTYVMSDFLMISAKGMPESTVIFIVDAAGQVYN